MKIKYLIPECYKIFFSEKFWNYDISETKATCNDCIQAPKKYKPHLKCCTFWPFIPNYIIGQILAAKSVKYKEAQEVIKNHIEKKIFNFPLGLLAPVPYQKSFKKNKEQIFGNNSRFLCPYYSTTANQCRMWLYRGSVCTSFYCESSYGEKGKLFWQHFENYFSYLEMALAEEVLAYNDYSPRDMSQQLEYLNITADSKIKSQGQTLNKHEYKALWKHQFNREIEFYIQSAQFVTAIGDKQAKEILGSLGKTLYNQLEAGKPRL